MCLRKKSWIPRIALRNKKVYKCVISQNLQYYTPYIRKLIKFPINKGEFVNNNNLFKSLFTKYIEDGYIHVFDNYESAEQDVQFFSNIGEKSVILTCVIPKFTIYFIRQEHDIATRKIKYLN